jgi:hypothetical protein
MPGGGKGGGSSSSTVTVHNGPISVDSDSTVSVVGLDNISIKSDSKQELILPQPLKTESDIDLNSKSELTTKSDISTDSKSDSKNALAVDLKPVSVDLCLNSSTKLPQGTIHQPFNIHLGFTLFGVEFIGMNFGGDSRITMQDLPKKPLVDWPAQQNAPAGSEPCAPQREGPSVHERGLRVRVR